MGYVGCHRGPSRTVGVRQIAAGGAAVAAVATVGTVVAPGAGAATTGSYYLDRGTSVAAKSFLGDPYVYGGVTAAGFDCSGFAQHLYAAFGYQIPRTAQEQYDYFHPISQSDAWGGDLVFFHDASGAVYHVGIYEGDGNMVSALDTRYGVKWTSVSWGLDGPGSYATYGTLSH